jgi:hypothetical protein
MTSKDTDLNPIEPDPRIPLLKNAALRRVAAETSQDIETRLLLARAKSATLYAQIQADIPLRSLG